MNGSSGAGPGPAHPAGEHESRRPWDSDRLDDWLHNGVAADGRSGSGPDPGIGSIASDRDDEDDEDDDDVGLDHFDEDDDADGAEAADPDETRSSPHDDADAEQADGEDPPPGDQPTDPDRPPPPHGQEFENRDDLIRFVKEFAVAHKYAVAIASNSPVRVRMQCVLGGKARKYVPDENKKRRRCSTRRVGCPFKLTGRRMASREGKWKLTVTNGLHTCDAGSFHNLPLARQLPSEAREHFEELYRAGLSGRSIRRSLQARFPSLLTTQKDIANMRQKRRKVELTGRSSMETLLEWLNQENYFARYEQAPGVDAADGTRRVKSLFFASPSGFKELRRRPTVLLMDCLHKTSSTSLSLLSVVSVTENDRTVNVAFALLPGEEAGDYIWALQCLSQLLVDPPKVIVTERELPLMAAVGEVFPTVANIISLRHISDKIASQLKGMIPGDDSTSICDEIMVDWLALCASASPEIYEEALKQLKAKLSRRLVVMRYLEGWLAFKECFVTAWTDRARHVGHTATLGADGNQVIARIDVELSSKNLLLAIEGIQRTLKDQESSEASTRSAVLSARPLRFNHPFLAAGLGKVSHIALDKIWEQLKQVDDPDRMEPCSGRFTTIFGLPCKHRIATIIAEGSVLSVNDIDHHWLIDRHEEEINISARDLGFFEHFDERESHRKCGHCKMTGHNKRTCPTFTRDVIAIS